MESLADYWQAFIRTDFYVLLQQQPWQYICPTVAIVLVLAAFAVEQFRRFTRRAVLARVFSMALLPPLLVAAALAMGDYNNFGNWRYGSFFNAYEFYHYYIGSKYAPEIHYKELYNATIVADAETGLKFKHPEGAIKNLNPKWKEEGQPYHLKVEQVLARKDEIKARFTSERWKEFVEDIRFFKQELVSGRWDGVLRDKGYNGSPAWSTVVGGLLSNNFPTSNRAGMLFLASLDLILIAITACFVIWAYGLRPALLMLVLLGTSYVMSYSHMKGAYLRTDFAMPIIISMCLIKKNRYASAGALMGYACVARVFPTVFLFGVGARMVWVTFHALIKKWREYHGEGVAAVFKHLLAVNRPYILFFTCAAAVVVAMFLAPIAYTGSADLWLAYQDKLSDHADDISPWRVGFKYFYMAELAPQNARANPPDTAMLFTQPIQYLEASVRHWWVKIVPARYNENRIEWYAIMALVLAVSLLAARGLKDHDAIAFSFVPCFFLAAPTYYYYIMLLIPMLFFAPYLNRPGRMIGAVALIAMAIPGYYLYAIWQQKFPTYYWHSVMYLALCIYMILLALGDSAWAFLKNTVTAPYSDDREFAREREKALEMAQSGGDSPEGGSKGGESGHDSEEITLPEFENYA